MGDPAKKSPSAAASGAAAAIPAIDQARIRELASAEGVAGCDVDDVAQDALLRILESRDRIDPDRDVAAYLDRVVRNEARMHHRRRRARRDVLQEDGELDMEDQRPDPEACAIAQCRAAFTWLLIDQVDIRRRSVFVHYKIAGLSLPEIAAQEAIPLQTAKKRLRLAWGDIERARVRWQAEQRRRGRPVNPALIPPLALGRRALAFLRRLGVKSVSCTFLVAAILANEVLPVTWSPVRPAAAGPDVPPVLLAEPSSVSSASVTAAATCATPVPTSADPAGASRRIRDPEQSLIERARNAMTVGGHAHRAEALWLLGRHKREFPNGRLAAERDALLLQLKTPS